MQIPLNSDAARIQWINSLQVIEGKSDDDTIIQKFETANVMDDFEYLRLVMGAFIAEI